MPNLPAVSTLLITIGLTLFVSCGKQKTQRSLTAFDINVSTEDLSFGDYTDAVISYTDGNGLTKHYSIPVALKYRGNASVHYEKKSFSLKFSCKTCFDLTVCHKKWKLNAEYVDKTLMRNKLSYGLFRLFSSENVAPEIDYATVRINGEFRGINTLTERIGSDLLGLVKHDTGAVSFKQPPISIPPGEHVKRHNDFVAFSNHAAFYKGFSNKAKKKLIEEVYYNQRFPSVGKRDEKQRIHELTEFIFNSSPDEFSNEKLFNQYFDIDNIIDWHLLLLVTNNSDGLAKNFYLYREETDKPFKFSPWDYDHSFGRDGDGELNQESFIDCKRVALLERLLNVNPFNYKQKLLNKYLLLKNNDILTVRNIHSMIETNATRLAPYVQENEAKWPVDAIDYFEGSGFENEVNLMKNWIQSRLPKVEKYLSKLQQQTHQSDS